MIFETLLPLSPCSFVFKNLSSLFCCNYFLFFYYCHCCNHYYCLFYSHIIWLYFEVIFYRILLSIIILLIYLYIYFLPFYLLPILSSFLFHFSSFFFFFCHFSFLLCFKWVHHVLHLHVIIFSFIPTGLLKILREERQDHPNYRQKLKSLFPFTFVLL